MSDERSGDERTDVSPGSTETTTAVDDPFIEVPDADSDDASSPGHRDEREPLLERDRADGFRRRWDDIQTDFVDRPRESVERADRLVLETIQQLQASFTLARERLESQWGEGADASTEDLRQALRRYRSFFDRLLGA